MASPLVAAFFSLFPLCTEVAAQNAQKPEVRVRHMHYTEEQVDGRKRMSISAPMAFIRTIPITDWTFESSFTYDGVSGASPYYLDAVSGASGKGIRDHRYEGQFRVAHSGERDTVGATFFISDEDDYRSTSGAVDYMRTLEDGNTQVFASANHAADAVSSSNDPTLNEHRDTTVLSFGVTQLLNEEALLSTIVGVSFDRGYLTDPYKLLDQRPDERHGFTLTNRLVHYLEATDGALHVDFRLYADTWDIYSQTLECVWFQPLGESWLIRPSIRYYAQTDAAFFSDQFPPRSLGLSHYSADQRLGTFGSLTAGLRLEYKLLDATTIDISAYRMDMSPDYSLLRAGSGFQGQTALFYGLGLYQAF